jgi:PAS domain S-box-containing protein
MAEQVAFAATGSAKHHMRRLLIVEDDEDFAESLENFLRPRGLDIRLVREVDEVEPMLEQFSPDVALVDVRLGRSSGLDVVAMLKKRRAPVLTVVMTAYVAADTAIEALRRGAYDYLTKPFDPSELFATLDRCFERIDLERARREAEAAQQKSESRLRAIFANSLDLIAVVEPRPGKVKFVSPSVTRLLGYDPDSDVTGTFYDYVHEDDRERAALALEDCSEPGATCTVELRVRHKDGSWRWFEVAARGLEGDPAIAGILICARDVTERRAIEEQLRQAQRLEAVGQLTGGVAHDFNNLLAVIMGNLDLLKRTLNDQPEEQQLVDGAMHASERGATLIRRLLAFSRRQTLSPRAVDMNNLLRSTVDLVHRAVGARVQLETDLAADLWSCTADAAQLETAVLNLAINARDAMAEGGSLVFRTRNVYLQGDRERNDGSGSPHVCIDVTDTGTGIPPELRERIFEPFFSTKAPGRGTGLGLSMVFGFVKQSNGQIRVQSEMGKGTTFSLYFPKANEKAPGRTVRSPEIAPRARNETILLVEDDVEVRVMIQRLLEELGYRVVSTENGRAALAMVNEGLKPDLLLSDVVLPDGPSGFELAAEIRGRLPGVRLLFTSGYAQDLVARRPESVASAPLLHKPFHRTELAHHVRRALDLAV